MFENFNLREVSFPALFLVTVVSVTGAWHTLQVATAGLSLQSPQMAWLLLQWNILTPATISCRQAEHCSSLGSGDCIGVRVSEWG